MDCVKFQDSISDYIENAVDSRARAECAAHRLICRDCRELYNDVRATMQALNSLSHRDSTEPEGLQDRILAATTTGEMVSCGEFDRLLERYFDGVILAPTFQTFQAHFERCVKCRRLLNGIEDAISMCREVKETEIEVPESLYDRIVASTIGAQDENRAARFRSSFLNILAPVLSPQMVVAGLILAAISLLILSRFGSVSNMTDHAGQKAENIVNQSQEKITHTGAMARSGFRRFSYEVNSFLFSGSGPKQMPGAANSGQPRIQPSPQQRPRNDGERKGESVENDINKQRSNKNQQRR